MLLIYLDGISPQIPQILSTTREGISVTEILKSVFSSCNFSNDAFYFTLNGKCIPSDCPVSEGVVHVVPRLLGGKGGFGSMLRAIGAQIEKTTNREACRDLSGRRLRDINEEKRLKNWINNKAEREREVAERKRKKLEKLRLEPKHDFSDKAYEEERSKLTNEVSSAIEKGFQVAAGNPGPSKTTSSSQPKKGFMFEDEEVSSGSSVSDSDDEVVGRSTTSQQDLKRKADSSGSEDSAKRRCLSPSSESSSCESSSQSSQDDKSSSETEQAS